MARSTSTARCMDDSSYGYERRLVLIEGGRSHTSAGITPAATPHLSLAAVACAIAVALVVIVAGELCHVMRVERSLRSCETQQVHVLPGQTMWELAQDHRVEGVQPDELVSWIQDVNGLDTVLLTPGQRLIVPKASKT